MNKKLIPVILIVVAGGVLFAWQPWKKADDGRILLAGNIELNEVDVAFKVPGKLMERTVNEGDSVQQGAVVARLERDQLLTQKAQAEAAIAVAEAQLAQAQTTVGLTRETTLADVAVRKADLGTSQAKLQELRNGSRPEEIRDAGAAVQSAEAELQRANADFQRAETLLKTDDISRQAFDQARQRKTAAESMLQSARQREALVKQGPRAEVIAQATQQTERAQAAVRLGEASLVQVKQREQEVAARRAEVARLKAILSQIEVQLEDTVSKAPVGGVVLVKSADVGEVLAAGTTVMTIGDIDHPWVRGYISERDLGRVKVGMPVKVKSDSFPGRNFDGRLTFIASEAEFTPKQIQTQQERVKLVYRVKVEVDNKGHELKSNMPVDAEIVLQ